MTRVLSGPEFIDFVLGYQRVAFRLETQDRYVDSEETEPLAKFLAGTPDYGWNDGWAAMMRRRSTAGQRMERVRVVKEPHSDYARFLLDLALVNVAAGEDIRYLPRHRAVRLPLPDYDFWLIDSIKVAVLRFDADGAMLGAELSTDAESIARHLSYRDAAWDASIPLHEYIR